MKGALFAFSLLLAPTFIAKAAERIIPAGSLLQCTIAEPKLSSKTAQLGDPVLCQLSYAERYGRATVPYGSYLVGRFEDYKDPGHLFGKGYMELRFDRMVMEPDIILPVSAKVVDVPGYSVDKTGRIQGKGHPVRDSIEWALPILWPIDLINLPRRGPRPTLKGETRLTLKIMDDLAVPVTSDPQRTPSGLYHREPSAYVPQSTPAPPPQMIVYAPSPVYLAPPPPLVPVMVMRHGTMYRTIAP